MTLPVVLLVVAVMLSIVDVMVNAQPASSWTSLASSGNGKFVCASSYLENIYCSSDAGANWFKTPSPQLPWVSMAMSTEGDFIVAVTSSNSIYISTTFGDTWKVTAPDAYSSWTAVDCDTTGKYIVAASSSAVIGVSDNFGHSWTYVVSFPAGALFHGITSDATGQYVIAVGLSYIFYSTDFGETFVSSESPMNGIFFQSVCSDETGKNALATSSSGIYRSTDFGSTWQIVYASTNIFWGAIAFNNAGEVAFAGTSNGGLYRSGDSGLTWNEMEMLPTESFWGDVTIDESGTHVVAAVDGGALYTSSDSGTTWSGHLTSCEVGTSYNSVTGDCEYCCTRGKSACTLYNDGSSISCEACPEFQVSFEDHAYCSNPCTFPYVPAYPADTEGSVASYTCSELNIQAPTVAWSVLIVVITGMYFLNLVLVEQHVARYRPAVPIIVICSTAIPVMEHLSLWLFILRGTLHSRWILIASCVCLTLTPMWLMLTTLWRKRRDANLVPSLFLVPSSLSSMNSWPMFKDMDDVPKLLIQCILLLPTLIFNSIWLVPMLFFLFILFATKLHAYGPIYNTWFHRWSGREDIYEKEQLLSVPEYAESRVLSAILQSVPMIYVLYYNRHHVQSVDTPHPSMMMNQFALVTSILSLGTLLLRYGLVSLRRLVFGSQGICFPTKYSYNATNELGGTTVTRTLFNDDNQDATGDNGAMLDSKEFFPVQYPPVARMRAQQTHWPFSIFAPTYWLDIIYINDPEADLEAYKRRSRSGRFSFLYSVDQYSTTGKDLLGRPLPSGKTAEQQQEEEEAEALAEEEEFRLEEVRLRAEVDNCIARNRAKWQAFRLEIRRAMSKIEIELNRRIEAQAALAAAADLIHIPSVASGKNNSFNINK